MPLELDQVDNVTVPATAIPCSHEIYQDLVQLINPLRQSDNYGIDILLDVVLFLQESA